MLNNTVTSEKQAGFIGLVVLFALALQSTDECSRNCGCTTSKILQNFTFINFYCGRPNCFQLNNPGSDGPATYGPGSDGPGSDGPGSDGSGSDGPGSDM